LQDSGSRPARRSPRSWLWVGSELAASRLEPEQDLA